MVKKILILSTFLFIILSPNLDVNAIPLGYPVVWYHENGVAHQLEDVRRDTWGGTEVYVGSTIGRISTGYDITRVDYNWYNANLCSGKTINIKGRLFGLGQNNGLFNENASIVVYSNLNQMTCTTSIVDQNQMDFNCYSDIGGGDISVYMSTVVNYPDNFRTAISRNIDVTCDVTNEAIVSQSIENTQNIINNQNSNTNTITQNQDTNTQNIINNQNQNKQDVINNQNQNTQDVIDNQNQTFGNVCYSNLFDISTQNVNKYVSGTTGNLINSNDWNTSDLISVKANTNYLLSTYTQTGLTSRLTITQYQSDGTFISRTQNSSTQDYQIIKTHNNTGFVRISYRNDLYDGNKIQLIEGDQKLPYVLYGENKCINKLDEQTSVINDLNDTLNDTSQPNTNQDIQDMDNMVASDTPISDLITMPLTLINAYINGVNSSCSPVNLGNLYGTDLVLPCINLEQRFGSNLWNTIDILCCIFLCYDIAMLFISAFDGITSLRDDFEGLYQPRHAAAGYQPKHGGGE